jgi:hypothetical protein
MNAENEAYQETTEKFSKTVGEVKGHIEETVSYDPVAIFESFTNVVVAMDKVSTVKMDRMENTFLAMSNVDWATMSEIQNVFTSLNSLSPIQLGAVADEIWRIININVP